MATPTTSYEPDRANDVERAFGWMLFAVIMLGIAGAWNVVEGTAAIFKSKVYADEATYVFGDLRTWGWILLAFGIVELVAVWRLAKGGQIARWFGVGVASLSAIGELLFAGAAPIWSLAMFAVSILVIYALSFYGGQVQLRSDL